MNRYFCLGLVLIACGGAQTNSKQSKGILDRLNTAPTVVVRSDLRSLKASPYLESWNQFIGRLVSDLERSTLTSNRASQKAKESEKIANIWNEVKDGWKNSDELLIAVRYVHEGSNFDGAPPPYEEYPPYDKEKYGPPEAEPDAKPEVAPGAYVPPSEDISITLPIEKTQMGMRGELPFQALVYLSGDFKGLVSRLPKLFEEQGASTDEFETLPDGSMLFSDSKVHLEIRPNQILIHTRSFLLDKAPAQPVLSAKVRALINRHQSSFYMSRELGLFQQISNFPFEGPMRQALGDDVADLFTRQAYYYQDLDFVWMGATFSEHIESEALLAFQQQESAKGYHELLEQMRELQAKDIFYITLGGDILADEWSATAQNKEVEMKIELSGKKLDRFTGRMEMFVAELALGAKVGLRTSGAFDDYLDESSTPRVEPYRGHSNDSDGSTDIPVIVEEPAEGDTKVIEE